MRSVAKKVLELERAGMTFSVDPDSALRVEIEDFDEIVAYIRERDRAQALEAMVRRAFAGGDGGLVLWLARERPELHAAVTGRLPDRVQLLWESGAPLGEFREALDELEAAIVWARFQYYERGRP